MQNSSDTWETILNRVRKLAEENKEIQNVDHPNGGGCIVMPGDQEEPLERSPEEKSSWLLRCSGVPKKYCECSFENFTGNEKLTEYLKTLSYGEDSIVLYGGPGCGKTHLAAAIMRHTQSGFFVGVPELLLRIRDSFNDSSKCTEKEIIDEYSQKPFLTLDDLGAEKTTEYSITTLYLILNKRINDGLKTVITTNLSVPQLSSALGERIGSRISSMNIVKINMPDYRKRRQ